MKFSKLWLKELIGVDIATEKLAEQLTMAGLEVAAIKPVAPEFHGVVVGEVLEVTPHPNADKLKVCQVDIGDAGGIKLNIVCGAPNVRPKLKVPVALVGAKLPDELKIKRSKLRGVDSAGMLCSAVELGLPEISVGLFELADDAPLGVDLRQYLMLDDEVIELELTSNRGDCLSMLGIAREIAAISRIHLIGAKSVISKCNHDFFPVSILAKEACPHYCGRIIRGIDNHLCTPFWIQARLLRLGLRPINLIVDVTNYVMLELGQPLHAFDLSKLDQKVEVRYAKAGETITLLDERKVELNSKTLIIADVRKPLAIAGVMGGKDSAVSLDTNDIFLESAFFTPEKISGVARSYNLQTDSSYRFERGVDPDLQLQALDRATSLIVEAATGTPSRVTEVLASEYLPPISAIILHRENIRNILGVVIGEEQVVDMLLHLGMKVVATNFGWQVTAPGFRSDLKIEEDLIEEIARIYGYHLIPEQKIITELSVEAVTTNRDHRWRLGALMEDLGYHEVITYSFIDKQLQELFDPDNPALKLANPISSEMSVMRTTLWPGLVSAVKYNAQRQQSRARFFEMGLRFLPKENSLDQEATIAGVTFGDLYSEQWGIKSREQVDFFDLKNDVTTILQLFAPGEGIEYLANAHRALHPLRSVAIKVNGIAVGFIGELHPRIKQQLELTKKTYLFEINLSFLMNKLKNVFKKFSRFPKIQRDLAITINKKISWAEIRHKIVDISGELLQNATLFDIYCNENIGLDNRSMAIRLVFQSTERTLSDIEVESLVNEIILTLGQTFNAILRG